MTETSSQTRRHTITKAVLAVEKNDESNLNDIVDMLLTLKKKDLATCLFNKAFLKTKIKQAKDALDIFVEEQQQQQQELHKDENTYHEPAVMMSSPPHTSTIATNYYYQPREGLTPSYIQHVALPPKGSRAIPIVAPPPMRSTPSPVAASASRNTANANVATVSTVSAVNTSSTKIATITNGTSSTVASPNNKTTIIEPKVLDINSMNVQELGEEIDKFLRSLDGLPLHEKKQSLGDRLFPLVKVIT
jgi:hypothetical protein